MPTVAAISSRLAVLLRVSQRLYHAEQLFIRHEAAMILELVLVNRAAEFGGVSGKIAVSV